jgi:hypothetical protein
LTFLEKIREMTGTAAKFAEKGCVFLAVCVGRNSSKPPGSDP